MENTVKVGDKVLCCGTCNYSPSPPVVGKVYTITATYMDYMKETQNPHLIGWFFIEENFTLAYQLMGDLDKSTSGFYGDEQSRIFKLVKIDIPIEFTFKN